MSKAINLKDKSRFSAGHASVAGGSGGCANHHAIIRFTVCYLLEINGSSCVHQMFGMHRQIILKVHIQIDDASFYASLKIQSYRNC